MALPTSNAVQRNGYTGTMPERSEKAAPEHATPPKNFKGNEVHDGHGHVNEGKTK